MSLYFKSNIKQQLLKSLLFILIVTVVVTILYTALCITSATTTLKLFSDNLDYIFPFIVLAIVLKNFSYMNQKEELEEIVSLPITQRDVFKFKYLTSLFELGLIYLMLLLVTYILVIVIDPKIANGLNIDMYILSLFIKGIACYLVLNFFLYFYAKGNSFIHSMCFIALASIVASIIGFIIMLGYLRLHNQSLPNFFILLPINFTSAITYFFKGLIFNFKDLSNAMFHLIVIVLFTLSCIYFSISLYKNKYKIIIENQGEVYVSNTKRVVLVTLSLLSIFSNALLIDGFEVTVVSIFLINFIYYIVHSSFASRFKPTNKEWIVYFILFVLTVVVGLLL